MDSFYEKLNDLYNQIGIYQRVRVAANPKTFAAIERTLNSLGEGRFFDIEDSAKMCLIRKIWARACSIYNRKIPNCGEELRSLLVKSNFFLDCTWKVDGNLMLTMFKISSKRLFMDYLRKLAMHNLLEEVLAKRIHRSDTLGAILRVVCDQACRIKREIVKDSYLSARVEKKLSRNLELARLLLDFISPYNSNIGFKLDKILHKKCASRLSVVNSILSRARKLNGVKEVQHSSKSLISIAPMDTADKANITELSVADSSEDADDESTCSIDLFSEYLDWQPEYYQNIFDVSELLANSDQQEFYVQVEPLPLLFSHAQDLVRILDRFEGSACKRPRLA